MGFVFQKVTMVFSTNKDASFQEFENLMCDCVQMAQGLVGELDVSKLKGKDMEPFVYDIMCQSAKGTRFEGSIELVSGQKFPDIITQEFFGVEVKSTSKDHWKTTGNSILETTAVSDLERIFLFFGKLGGNVEFRCRPYEECLSNIVVTHSPRYLIDMELDLGASVLDDIGVSYYDFRKLERPTDVVVQYYKNKLKDGQELWWIDNSHSSKMILETWNNVETEQRLIFMLQGMVLFPEIFSRSGDKFSRFASWLVVEHTIVCPNVRDIFTAGGQTIFEEDGVKISKLPRVFKKLIDNGEMFISILEKTPARMISRYYSDKSSLDLTAWAEYFLENARWFKDSKRILEVLRKK